MNATSRAASILVVDDDPDLLRLMQIRLTAAGYAVSTAESAERALAQASVARPQLVVTDLRMGGMDGMALFEAHPRRPTRRCRSSSSPRTARFPTRWRR